MDKVDTNRHTPTPAGKALRLNRARIGITQIELARVANVKQGTISMIESGVTRKPDVLTLAKLAKAMDIDVSELIF